MSNVLKSIEKKMIQERIGPVLEEIKKTNNLLSEINEKLDKIISIISKR